MIRDDVSAMSELRYDKEQTWKGGSAKTKSIEARSSANHDPICLGCVSTSSDVFRHKGHFHEFQIGDHGNPDTPFEF